MSIYTALMTLVLITTLHGQVQTGRIIGGHEAVPHSRPYMVLVTQHNESAIVGYCGGFLVNEEFVMTAAHCQANSYTIHLGAHDVRTDREIQIRSVAQSFPHEKFDSKKFENDIMLLKFSTKASFSKNVASIPLADKHVQNVPRSCSVSGWGYTSRKNGPRSPLLLEVDVNEVDDKFVRHMYCSKGKTGPGMGDSGGPLVCEDGRAYGVVSGTFTPSRGDPISCFVKIPDYRTWVDQIIGQK